MDRPARDGTLLHKPFLGAGKIVFVYAATIPALVSRCYKSGFLGAGKGLAPVNAFSEVGQGMSRP